MNYLCSFILKDWNKKNYIPKKKDPCTKYAAKTTKEKRGCIVKMSRFYFTDGYHNGANLS